MEESCSRSFDGGGIAAGRDRERLGKSGDDGRPSSLGSLTFNPRLEGADNLGPAEARACRRRRPPSALPPRLPGF